MVLRQNRPHPPSAPSPEGKGSPQRRMRLGQTRTQPESVTNSIAKKGQGRNSPPGCRGSAPAGSRGKASGERGSPPVPSINTRKLYEEVTNSIAKKGQGRNFPLPGSGGSAPWVSLMKGKKAVALSTSTMAIFQSPGRDESKHSGQRADAGAGGVSRAGHEFP